MNLLQRYLKKLNVNEFSELTDEEKETYKKWQEVLMGRKLTDDDVSAFFELELSDALSKLSPACDPRTDVFLKLKIDMIRKIQMFLMSPQNEKKMLEANLQS